MKQTKDYTLAVFLLLVLFLLGLSANASETKEVITIDFTTKETEIHEVTFDDKEATILTVDADGNIEITVLGVEDESN